MYNSITEELIKGVPYLQGLDRDRLPQDLAEAYSRIVSARLTLATTSITDINSVLEPIVKLGHTYLGMVNFVDVDTRKSVAFVAGTAFELLHTYRGRHECEVFSETTVCTACIASLLFMIAGAPSDAIEVLGALAVPYNELDISSKIRQLLTLLATGQLEDLLRISTDIEPADNVDVKAFESLYSTALIGIKKLAESILGEAPLSEALTILRETKNNCIDDCTDLLAGYFTEDDMLVSTFPGPFIFTSLMERAAEELHKHAIVNIPVPTIENVDGWEQEVKRIARIRPYLWENHIRIINIERYLDTETSSVFSLPTGAGKTSLAQLKALATIVDGKKVIFLAPTHALVSQVTKDFRKFFPQATVLNSFLSEGEYAETEDNILPEITIMTPERYLTLTMLAPEVFASVGLVIIDECHILHAGSIDSSYRATDTMIGLIRSFEVAPNADFLLMSAMISNPSEIASWLSSQTGRRCISVLDEWKPTRQARCCVIYSAEEISSLHVLLQRARRQSGGSPNTAIQRQLRAHPFGFFCLNQTWHSTELEEDYVVLPLSDSSVSLKANSFWRLTSNRNSVSATIAGKLARAGIKTIVFAQQVKATYAIAKQVYDEIRDLGDVLLNDIDLELKARLISEFGQESSIFLPLGLAGCHHGLLFPEERELTERLFTREGGLRVLAATPTLAQGMNLPAEAVVIAGDERFDSDQNGQEQLEPHEILNAAGRAGRAGHRAQGIVIVVPGSVVDYDSRTSTLSEGWHSLQENVFSQLDQCLDITDPLELLLDTIHAGSAGNDRPLEYIFRRLGSLSDSLEGVTRTLSRSFGSHLAAINGTTPEFNDKVAAAIRFGQQFIHSDSNEYDTWINEIGNELGFAPDIINTIYVQAVELTGQETVFSYVDWLIDSGILFKMLKHKTVTEIVKALLSVQERSSDNVFAMVSLRLKTVIQLWITGATMREIEVGAGATPNQIKKCEIARKLALRWAPDISYCLGAVTKVMRHLCDSDAERRMPILLASLAPCIKEGFDVPEKLAMSYLFGAEHGRVMVHNLHAAITTLIPNGDPFETFTLTSRRVRGAMVGAGFL